MFWFAHSLFKEYFSSHLQYLIETTVFYQWESVTSASGWTFPDWRCPKFFCLSTLLVGWDIEDTQMHHLEMGGTPNSPWQSYFIGAHNSLTGWGTRLFTWLCRAIAVCHQLSGCYFMMYKATLLSWHWELFTGLAHWTIYTGVLAALIRCGWEGEWATTYTMLRCWNGLWKC